MARKFNSNGIADGTLPGTKISSGTISASLVGSVRISSISITDNSYVVLDDTAVILTGGYIKIIGTGFVSGCSVAIDTIIATSVSFVSATQLNVQVPAKAAGTYNIYLTTPTGAVAIRVNAITYSSTPTWSSTSPLPGGVNNTAISIQLGATSDSTVSYTVQAGSTLPTGLTLSSSGLLSGTVTGLVLETTYNFTVVATDVELQDSPKAFSITIVVSDPYFKNTVLLLQGDATPFTADASTNNFAVTIAGDTKPNSMNPYTPGYYSNYFVNGYPYLRATANSAFNFGTGDFTVEFWYYSVSIVADSRFISNASYAASGIDISYESTSSRISWYIGSTSYNTATLPAANKWHHIAYSRTSTTLYVYVDGVLVNTYASFTANITSASNLTIGGNVTGVETLDGGYISNLRLVKGVSIYSTGANFTPSTTPLTAISGTSLLTCQSNRFIDNSVNNFTFTVNGSVTVNSFQPFTPNSSYSSYGSGYFDGTGDYLLVPTAAPLVLAGGVWTIECWCYLTSSSFSTYRVVINKRSGSSAASYDLYFNITDGYLAFYNGTGYTSTVVPIINAWNHIAAVYDGTNINLYMNGVRVLQSATTNPDNGGNLYIAGDENGTSNYFIGYINDVRIVKGTALYSGTTYTVPSVPLTAIANTSLLTLQNNQAQNNNQFRDSSTNNFAVTRTGTPTQGTFTPFSQTGWSGYFDGTAYIEEPTAFTSALVGFAGGLFTIECWLNGTYNTGSGGGIIGAYAGVAANGRWYMGFSTSGNLKFVYTTGTGSENTLTSTATFPFNSWSHLAVTIDATSSSAATVKLYINGVGESFTSQNMSTQTTSYGPTRIGAGMYIFGTIGYISNLRIVKGSLVYIGNFTPPTVPLAATQSSGTNIAAITGTATSLLTLQSNYFKDNSTNNFTITAGGAPSVQAFSPFAPSTAYSATTVGGSMYFDGSSYLSVPPTSNFAFGTGDFTFECYIYGNSTTFASGGICSPNVYNGGSLYWAILAAGGNVTWQNSHGNTNLFSISAVAYYNTWLHITVVRSSGTTKMYFNGVQVASAADSNNYVLTTTYVIARNGDGPYNMGAGYISNLRITKGTAVYTAAFTPPTAPLTAIPGTSLLLNATNAGIFDATGKNDLITVGDARVSTSVTKYGSSSMYFDGTSDYLTTPLLPNLQFGTGDFTVECWNYMIARTNSTPAIFANYNNYINGALCLFAGHVSGTTTAYQVAINGASFPVIQGGTIAYNTWVHLAVVRYNGIISLYVNGTSVGTPYSTAVTLNGVGSLFYIGTTGDNLSPGSINGYLDDLRVTKGIARYTTTFTPPSQAMLGM